MHRIFRIGLLQFSLLFTLESLAQNQSDEQAALQVIDGFFSALESKEEGALAELMYPGSLNISAARQGSNITLTARSYSELLERFADGPPIIERYWDHTLLVQSGIAVFWAPYDLYVGDSFSHCGVDSFQLVKENGRWWLTNLSWTIEREDCTLHPQGPPQR